MKMRETIDLLETTMTEGGNFTSEDYEVLETKLRAAMEANDERQLQAVLSNSINVILGALNDAVLKHRIVARQQTPKPKLRRWNTRTQEYMD